MGSFGCCLLWFLIGFVLGWLLNYFFCRRCCRKNKVEESSNIPPAPPPAPVAKVAETPVAAAPVEPTEKPPAPKPKAKASTSAKVKPKTAPKVVTIDVAAAKAAGFKIKNADDLTVIEGIGPKINELFKDNGLKTFADVASAKVSEMRAILDKGGARFRIANPGTWAKQAKLASNNKWKELKKLQDELSGGVKK